MIKALIKKLYFKLFPDRADISKERVDELEWALNPLTEVRVTSIPIKKKTLQADWNIQKEEYEIFKHNPDYMKFVKERIALNLVKGIEDKIEIRTDFNPCFNTVRIIGRLDFWEEEKDVR